MSGSGISWAICKSARRSKQITTPAPHHSVFYRPDALPADNQQRQSTEGFTTTQNKHKKLKPGLDAFYDTRPGNGEGLFSKEKISKEKVKKKRINGEACDINKQTIYIYI